MPHFLELKAVPSPPPADGSPVRSCFRNNPDSKRLTTACEARSGTDLDTQTTLRFPASESETAPGPAEVPIPPGKFPDSVQRFPYNRCAGRSAGSRPASLPTKDTPAALRTAPLFPPRPGPHIQGANPRAKGRHMDKPHTAAPLPDLPEPHSSGSSGTHNLPWRQSPPPGTYPSASQSFRRNDPRRKEVPVPGFLTPRSANPPL